MINRLFILFLMLGLGGLLAQNAPLTYGTKAGLNMSLHYGIPDQSGDYEVKLALRPGLVAGAWLDMEVLPQFKVGYELLYSQKGSREQITLLRVDGEELEKPAIMNVRYDLDYLEIPVLFKLRAIRGKKLALESILGTAMSLKIHGYHELDGTVWLPQNGDYEEIEVNESSDLKGINMFDYSLIYGSALHYSGKLKLSLELRFTLGWDYLLLPTHSMGDPAELRNQTYSAILGIQF